MPLVQQIPRIFSDTPRPVVDGRLEAERSKVQADDWKSSSAATRLTLQLKCEGLDPAQLGHRAVKPALNNVATWPDAAHGRGRAHVVPPAVRGLGRAQAVPVWRGAASPPRPRGR